VRAAGLVLILLGTVLAVRSALLLAGRGRPVRGRRPAFVVAGPYLRMRNPLLAGALVALLGLALTAASWTTATLAVGAWLGAHLWVVRVEEPNLLARFGTAYAEYVRRVPRWLPRRAAEPADD
jgi:protein-S-isoprenylcysteine O-methyltransferase Ste14